MWTGGPTGGFGGTYRNLTGIRGSGVAYINSSPGPILVSVLAYNAGNASQGYMLAYVDGTLIGRTTVGDAGVGWYNSPSTLTFIVPALSTYSVSVGYAYISNWVELD